MKLKNLAILVMIITGLILSVYFTCYSDILDHPYMIGMTIVLSIALLWSCIYLFNYARVQLKHGPKFSLRCKHDYNLVNQYEMKSEFDIVSDAARTPNTHCSITRRLITDYKCSKCGKIKRLTAKTPR